VQVAAGRPAGRADEADDLALLDDVALLDEELRLVAVGGLDPGRVLDDRAQTPGVRHPGVDDGAVGSGADRGAAARLEVDAGVEHRAVQDGVDAGPEGRHLAARHGVDESQRGQGACDGGSDGLRRDRRQADRREHEEAGGAAEGRVAATGRDRVAEQRGAGLVGEAGASGFHDPDGVLHGGLRRGSRREHDVGALHAGSAAAEEGERREHRDADGEGDDPTTHADVEDEGSFGSGVVTHRPATPSGVSSRAAVSGRVCPTGQWLLLPTSQPLSRPPPYVRERAGGGMCEKSIKNFSMMRRV
jgi:hypothetical protein